MYQLMAISVCFFNIISNTSPMCFTQAMTPLYFSTQEECHRAVDYLVEISDIKLKEKDVGIVYGCKKLSSQEIITTLYTY